MFANLILFLIKIDFKIHIEIYKKLLPNYISLDVIHEVINIISPS